jgi:hypothetical protein
MIEAASCEVENPFDRLLLILAGKEKSGKSRCAATARKPVLFFDFDRRRQSLAGLKDVYAITIADEGAPRMPTGFNDLLSILSKLEGGATIKDLIPGSNDTRRPKTLVFDSLTSFGKCAGDHAMYSNPALCREITVTGMKIKFPNGWDTWNAESSMVYSAVMRAMAVRMPGQTKPEMDIILCFHEQAEETPDSNQEKRKFTGRVELYPGRYQIFNKYFSEVWRVSRESGGLIPKIQVIPDYRFAASSGLDFSKINDSQINDPAKGPNIERMIELVLGKTNTLPTQFQSSAVSSQTK